MRCLVHTFNEDSMFYLCYWKVKDNYYSFLHFIPLCIYEQLFSLLILYDINNLNTINIIFFNKSIRTNHNSLFNVHIVNIIEGYFKYKHIRTFQTSPRYTIKVGKGVLVVSMSTFCASLVIPVISYGNIALKYIIFGGSLHGRWVLHIGGSQWHQRQKTPFLEWKHLWLSQEVQLMIFWRLVNNPMVW